MDLFTKSVVADYSTAIEAIEVLINQNEKETLNTILIYLKQRRTFFKNKENEFLEINKEQQQRISEVQ